MRKEFWYKLVSLESIFQYESNGTNYVQYNQDFVVQFFRSNFALENVCALSPETEVVVNCFSNPLPFT